MSPLSREKNHLENGEMHKFHSFSEKQTLMITLKKALNKLPVKRDSVFTGKVIILLFSGGFGLKIFA